MNGLTTRPDLPRSPVFHAAAVEAPSVSAARADVSAAHPARRSAPAAANLGPYAPLIARDPRRARALRRQLSAAASDDRRARSLSAHLDRRPRDRAGRAADLLRRFIREFRPEQIKEYLAKEVIGPLPNASAIDLSQFAGLNAGRGDEEPEEDDSYSELLAELRSAKPSPGARPYEVNLDRPLVGSRPRRAPPRAAACAADAARRTQRRDRDRGRRRQPPRRAAIGGAGPSVCDRQRRRLRHRGERRLCEPAPLRDLARSRHVVGHRRRIDQRHPRRARRERAGTQRLVAQSRDPSRPSSRSRAGARIVLSAYGDGDAEELSAARARCRARRDSRDADRARDPRRTRRRRRRSWRRGRGRADGRSSRTWHRARARSSSTRASPVLRRALARTRGSPSTGRTRACRVITSTSPRSTKRALTVVVHGDNGVRLAGTTYPPGARLHWKVGRVDRARPRHRARAGVRAHVVAPRFRLTAARECRRWNLSLRSNRLRSGTRARRAERATTTRQAVRLTPWVRLELAAASARGAAARESTRTRTAR